MRKKSNNVRSMKHQQNKKNNKLSVTRKRRAAVILVVLLFFILLLGFQIINNKIQLHKTNQQIAIQTQKLNKQKKENKKLRLKKTQLNDKNYLEKLIRSRYYYSKKGETVYSFPKDSAFDE
ncbi:septum formation initiator family protein [Lactobacillus sp. S2-2]|uniref:septum formation initiator family protein n=1 Tax=Lactobacillus sp. S2-2 TaxID=2692917 RepID=UPI001F402301|nr:septum formation initiator family protein [Lactobacillus sp. S2-2]